MAGYLVLIRFSRLLSPWSPHTHRHFESLNPALKENLLEYWYHLGVDHVFASFVQGHSMELRGQNMAKELKPFHSFFVRQS